ncbi:Tat pathway signal protein [Brevundimonas bullata]|uniref:Tat pathway signal protein n=1 Tax=Brevundimonas bullata TaxID=13160 RepID=UPI000E0B46DB|nr:Tat pathway signal protein [Brevundimonas bullata]WQE36390.1 Tat pathway signal protein [Brevundimonas bullata]
MDRRALIGLAALGSALAAAEAAMASGKSSGGGAPANAYIPLPTATATILRRDGRRGVMTVEVGVDVADEALRTRADQSRPRLSAAYNEVVRLAGERILPGAPPDVEWLSRALQAATDRVLGKAGAKLLLGTVMVV